MPAYSIQFRRGTAADHSAFTGELAEITIDITNNRVVLHDGETAGGIPLAKVSDLPIDVGDLTDVNGHIAAANSGGATYTISGATYSGSVNASGNSLRFFIYNDNGTKMFTCDGGRTIKEHSLSTAYDISTANWTHTAQSSDLTNITAASIDGGDFSADGTTLIVCHQISSPDSNDITQYDLTTAFDISTITSHTAVLDTRPDAGVSIGGAAAVQFGDNGNKLFALLNYPDLVMEYALSTPYDISTASFTTSFNFKTATGADNLLEMQFNSSGTKLLMTDNQNDRLYQIDLSTGFDLNTAAYNNNFINFSTIDTIPQALKFNDDDSKLYVAGGQNNKIYTFELVQE